MEEGKNKLADGVYLVKKGDDYKIIRPPKKDITKPLTRDNLHLSNLIGIKHNGFSIVIIIILILSAIAYKNDTEECREILNNPSIICGNSDYGGWTPPRVDEINITNFWDNKTFVNNGEK